MKLRSDEIIMIKRFLRFEQKYNLGNYIINGFRPWFFVRFWFFNYWERKVKGVDEIVSLSRADLAKENEACFSLENTFDDFLEKFSPAKIVFIPHPRRVKNAVDGFDSIYTDDLVIEVKDCIILEPPMWSMLPIEFSHYIPNSKFPVQYTDYIEKKINDEIKQNIHWNSSFYCEIVSFVEKIGQIFELEFNVSLDESIKALIIEKIMYPSIAYPYYERLFKKIKPQIVYETYTPDSYCSFVINSICKKMGVQIVELQHGIIDQENAIYYFFNKDDIERFSEYVPDKLFAFGKKMYSEGIFYQKNQIYNVGFPYLERNINMITQKNKDVKKNKILFLSNGTIGKELFSIACSVADQLANQSDMEVMFKLHPYESPSRYDVGWRRNIKVVDPFDNLYELFSQSILQVGISSTAIYEGL